MTRIIKLTPTNLASVISQTSRVLSDGGLVVFPSDTVYGLLVDATDESAISKLILFKNRAPGKAISIFINGLGDLGKYSKFTEKQKVMIEKLLPGPFTCVLDSKHAVSKKLESEKGAIGVRVPDYLPVQKLIAKYKNPVTATSANLGGRHPHYSIESLIKQLPKNKQDLIDLIVDAGKLPRNLPSTVIDLTSGKIKLLRKGDLIFRNASKYVSTSPKQTRKLGHFIISKMVKEFSDKPIVIILKGDLGAGKTEITRGFAEFFGIKKIVSPTYVIYFEYDIESKIENLKFKNNLKFVHADLYNIQESEELSGLGLGTYAKPGNVLIFEWGEKIGDRLQDLFGNAKKMVIEIKHVNEDKREIRIKI